MQAGIPLVFDLRAEKMGDRAASVAVAEWLTSFGPITFIEPPGDYPTSFHLSNYILPEGLSVQFLPIGAPFDGLDVHTPGLGADSLWLLTPYLNSVGIHGQLRLACGDEHSQACYDLMAKKAPRDEILFCLLDRVGQPSYNERREMNLWHARKMVNELRREGYNVQILFDKPHELFPDALRLPLNVCVERIARAKCVIAGDTGFSHVAAAFGTPLVALYPDWQRTGVSDLKSALDVAAWWEIPAWNYVKGFAPNAPYSRLRMIQMRSDHTWSIEDMKRGVKEIAG